MKAFDLAGDGISVTELSRSQKSLNCEGDGKEHHTVENIQMRRAEGTLPVSNLLRSAALSLNSPYLALTESDG